MASSSPIPTLQQPWMNSHGDAPSLSLPPLRSCTAAKELHQLHACVIKSPHPARVNHFIEACAASPVSESMLYARSVFDGIERPTPFAWNTMLRGYAQGDDAQEAILLFCRMLCYDHLLADRFTFPFLFKSCTRLPAIEEGRQCHACAVKRALDGDDYVQRSLVRMYVDFGEIVDAMKVFVRCSGSVGVVPWNDMIRGCCRAGEMDVARQLFDEMPQRNSVSWTVLINGYVKNGDMRRARRLFDEMPEKDGFAWNSMIRGYTQCGQVEEGRELFDEMPQKDVVSWTTMISGYSQNCMFKEALDLFHEMQVVKAKPNRLTLVSVLPAVAQLGALAQGKWIHAYIEKMNVEIDGVLGSALIDMYCKCGNISEGVQLFENLTLKELSTWNSMITGLAAHGLSDEARSIFSRFLDLKLVPNEITFTSVLNACGHGGFVDEGRSIFSLMVNKYNIIPNSMHYGCMVDILGRAGHLQEAKELIESMPMEPNAVIWKTLLNACRMHGNTEIISEVAEHVIELEPHDSGSYILISNTYRDAGLLDEGSQVRRMMNDRKVHKIAGCSWIEVNGAMHEFLAGGESPHPQHKEIWSMVVEMDRLLKQQDGLP
ncbi:pentatricopeptide repeat-containing protein At1g08070, chloroplastic-like [Nymphaea colorata]|uniref:Pentacotripeptide-repeat region of PRORP domain-containing protein n=1 Tax=Nymphaea colorata TaxID=210225 RepID=A0A5K1BWX4_9MAGN|nr:pentatricopeptide repeat-containing protein At1g08070, chloroplastic-like [Nymphaea colorata]